MAVLRIKVVNVSPQRFSVDNAIPSDDIASMKRDFYAGLYGRRARRDKEWEKGKEGSDFDLHGERVVSSKGREKELARIGPWLVSTLGKVGQLL